MSETENILESIKESFLRNFSNPKRLKVFGLLSFTLEDEEESFLKVNIDYKNNSSEVKSDGTSRSSSPPLLPPAIINSLNKSCSPTEEMQRDEFEKKDRRKSRKPQRKPLEKDLEVEAKRVKVEAKQEIDKNQPLNLENKSRVVPDDKTVESIGVDSTPINFSQNNTSNVIGNNQIGFTNGNPEIVASISQNYLTNYLHTQNQNLNSCQISQGPLNMTRSAIVSQPSSISSPSSNSSSQMVTLIGTLNNNTFTPIQQAKSSGNTISIKNQTSPINANGSRIALINGSEAGIQNSIDLKAITAAINSQSLSNSTQNSNGTILLSCMRQPTGELNFQIQPNRIAIQSLATFNPRQQALGTTTLVNTGQTETPLALVTNNQKVYDQKKENIPTNSITSPVCTTSPVGTSQQNLSMKPLRPDFRKFKIREDPTEAAIGKILENIKGNIAVSTPCDSNKITMSPIISITTTTSASCNKQPLPKLPLQPVTNNIRSKDNNIPNNKIILPNGNNNNNSTDDVENRSLKAYKCHFCTKTFNRKFCRERHERLHTGVKPYNCDVCNEKFIRLEDKKRHVRGYSHYSTNPANKTVSSSSTVETSDHQQSPTAGSSILEKTSHVKEDKDSDGDTKASSFEKDQDDEEDDDDDEDVSCSTDNDDRRQEMDDNENVNISDNEAKDDQDEGAKAPQKRSQRLMNRTQTLSSSSEMVSSNRRKATLVKHSNKAQLKLETN